jgi:FkbM family methyltransferase
MHSNIPGRSPIELPAFYESFAWYYPNCELQTKAWFVEQAGPDWVYLDCGANIGYYAILFSQLSPQGHVHAIEPTSTADMLETNLRHHRCPNATIHRRAVGKHSGPREEKIFRIWGQPPEVLTYDFTTIDDLVAELGLSRVDCLKIDVDSFDFEVLQGAEKTLARFDPWLVVELNHALGQRGQNNMAALDWLLQRGYTQALVLDHDNFVLRRISPPAPKIPVRSINLHFPATP